MRGVLRAALAAAVVATAGVAVATNASAYDGPASGQLTFSGDAGDYISQGQSWSYATPTDSIRMRSSASTVSLSIDGANADWWYLDIDAPDGEVLGVGTYSATRYPFNSPGAGFALRGEGRGCNTLTATVTIERIEFSDDVVSALTASFEQHCEGKPEAARGQISVDAGLPPGPTPTPTPTTTSPTPTPTTTTTSPTPTPTPTPTPVVLGLGLDPQGSVGRDGVAHVSGTLTCSSPAEATVTVVALQGSGRKVIEATAGTLVTCGESGSAAWTLDLEPGTEGFKNGDAQVRAEVADGGAEASGTVRLRRS